MSKQTLKSSVDTWNEFWFRPQTGQSLVWIRRGLCFVATLYFISAMGDVTTWFAHSAPASSSNLASFFRLASLQEDARWMISPLFVWDWFFSGTSLSESATVYRLYLIIGVLLAGIVAFAGERLLEHTSLPSWIKRTVSGSTPAVLLWVWFVGWANRVVLVAGIVEPVLSVSLAALAIAPIGSVDQMSWRHRFAQRLIATQGTMILLLTTATMLAGSIWWNGLGAYALAASAEDRLIDVRDTFFENSWIYDTITCVLLWGLPLACFLVWQTSSRRIGLALVWCWCLMVAVLSANILYAMTIAIIACSMGFGYELERAGEREPLHEQDQQIPAEA